MRRIIPVFCYIFLSVSAAAAQSPADFLPIQWNARTGGLEFVLTPQRLQQEFLRFTGLDQGVGSLSGGGDRGTIGPTSVCRFVRAGNRVLVVQENTRYRASAGSAELQHSVADSFPDAVLASLPILSESNGDLIVNANPLVLADTTGAARQLHSPSPGIPPNPGAGGRGAAVAWRLDLGRSAVVQSHTHAFPRNTETEALLTFVAENGQVSTQATPGIVSIRVHQSLVELPPAGYQPRTFDPRVGYFTQTFEDFSQAYDQPFVRHFVERWRLIKKDPNAAVSDPVQPLTFYLDQAIPEPIRGAIKRGILWWNDAFLQAGFSNVMVVKDLPLGADPNDFRYPTIEWVNREGRGWSVGQAQADPRTGEILHAVLQLDSYRQRTVHNYWDALLPSGGSLAAGVRDASLDSFAFLDGADPKLSQQQVMLERISLLACHEMGHVLGLQHNFIASTFGRGSVMDYYAPRVKIRPDGSADLSDAYMQGVGSYDKYAIQWGYSQGADLNTIVATMLSHGIRWASSQDALWSPYDDGPDPVTWLREVVPVRDALLKNYGPRMLRAGEPYSDLANRFALVYMFHQYGLLSALNVIGGAQIPPALAGDGQAPVKVWPEAGQREALQLEVAALQPSQLALPPKLWNQLAPLESQDQVERIERFRSSSGYLFDAFDGARAITDIVVNGLLDPARLERLETIEQEMPASNPLTAGQVIAALLHQAFPSPAVAPSPMQGVVQTEVAEGIMDLAANQKAPPEVQAVAWAGVNSLARQLHAGIAAHPNDPTLQKLEAELVMFQRNPKQFAPQRQATPAPVGPPVGGN